MEVGEERDYICIYNRKNIYDSRRGSSGRFLLSRTNINRYKASFLLSALSVFNENYTSH